MTTFSDERRITGDEAICKTCSNPVPRFGKHLCPGLVNKPQRKQRDILPTDVINGQFKMFDTLMRNVLISNINFETGYYFDRYPNTRDFVREVLKPQAELMAEHLEFLREITERIVKWEQSEEGNV